MKKEICIITVRNFYLAFFFSSYSFRFLYVGSKGPGKAEIKFTANAFWPPCKYAIVSNDRALEGTGHRNLTNANGPVRIQGNKSAKAL